MMLFTAGDVILCLANYFYKYSVPLKATGKPTLDEVDLDAII
jgi:hypothetical protein